MKRQQSGEQMMQFSAQQNHLEMAQLQSLRCAKTAQGLCNKCMSKAPPPTGSPGGWGKGASTSEVIPSALKNQGQALTALVAHLASNASDPIRLMLGSSLNSCGVAKGVLRRASTSLMKAENFPLNLELVRAAFSYELIWGWVKTWSPGPPGTM